MRKLLFTILLTGVLFDSLANSLKVGLSTDTLRLQLMVDSLNKLIKTQGLGNEELQVKENGTVTIKSLKAGQKFKFNFFELGNDSLISLSDPSKSKFGIRIRICDPRTHAPRHTIEFTTPDGNVVAFLFFNCFDGVAIESIHQLILGIRKECIEVKNYLK